MAGRLVGRAAEVEALGAALDRVAAGRPAVVAVLGEAGIGKTAVLAELAALGEARRLRVLAGRAVEAEASAPFAAAAAVLRPVAEDPPAAVLRALSGADRDRVRATLDPAGPPVERRAAHAGLRALLEALAPVVVVLDDAHWADPATAELLQLLLARRSRAPLLLALALRPAGAPPRLLAAVERVAEPGDAVLALRPLEGPDAQALLPDGLDPARGAAIVRESGGNPFCLLQLVRHGVAAGGERRAPGIPPAVAAALADELDRCGARAARVAHAAALSGEPVDVELCAAAARLPLEAVEEELDRLAAADLLRRQERGLAFRHPLVRRACEQAAGPAWRLGAHRRIAEALAARGAPARALAPHVEQSGRPGDPEAVALLTRAAREVLAAAPAVAARWLDAALELREDAGPARLEQLVPLAEALGAYGDVDRCRAVLAQVLAVLPASAGAWRARAITVLARLEHAAGRFERARALLDEALAGAPPGGEEEALLRLGLASNALQATAYADMHTEAAAAEACEAGPAVLATATAKRALAAYHLGRLPEALAAAGAAAERLDALPDEAVVGRVDGFAWLGWAEVFLERPAAALSHLDRGVRLAEASGKGPHLGALHAGRAMALVDLGRLGDAMAAGRAAFDDATLAGQGDTAVLAASALGAAHVAAGDPDAAVGLLGSTLASGDATAILAGVHLGAAQAAAGRPDEGRARVLAATGGAELPLAERDLRPWVCELLTTIDLARGEAEAAAAWAARAAAEAGLAPDAPGERRGPDDRRSRLPGRVAAAERAAAEVALHGGRADEAAALALAAAGRAGAAGLVLDAARGRLLAGRALAAAGDRDAALEHLTAAERALADAGARALRDRARRELRALGRRVGAAASAAPLTAREREVAALVAAGRRNREIAEALFISEHTVETHLRHLFAKLGVRSRAAVAARVNAPPDRHNVQDGLIA